VETLVLALGKKEDTYAIERICNDLVGHPAPGYEQWTVEKVIQIEVAPLVHDYYVDYEVFVIVEVSAS